MRRLNREIGVFNMSAIDLFASAMGAFMVVAVVLMPFAMKLSTAESRVHEAREKLDAAEKRYAGTLARWEKADATATEAEDGAEAAERRLTDLEKRKREAEKKATSLNAGLGQCQAKLADVELKDIDLVMMIDTTASMAGDIKALRVEATGIARILDRIASDVRIGVVAYRDDDLPQPSYITLPLELTPVDPAGLRRIKEFLNGLDVKGGPSCPEDVHTALADARAMSWRTHARKYVVAIGDAEAAPGDDSAAFAHARAIRALGVSVSSAHRAHPSKACPDVAAAERFFRQLAQSGGGRQGAPGETLTEAVLMAVIGK